MHPSRWLEVRPEGLFVRPGGFHVDPLRAVARAVVSHGHSDHARPGHDEVLATPETLAIMRLRLGEGAGGVQRPLAWGEAVEIGGVTVWLAPAGHVLGSAQVVLEHEGRRVVYTGDYKRRPDPTCAPFVVTPCDIFITEATFGLPVFKHPDTGSEVDRLLHRLAAEPERCVLVGAYALGKAQRLIMELRGRGHDEPIYIHGALERLCALYEELGVPLGELRLATGVPKDELKGRIVLAPPGALNDRWSRRLPDPITAMASGWMRIRQRARQRNVELPLVVSDHADWDELTQTIREVAPREVWITHGREEALKHWCMIHQIKARELNLVGYEDEDD